MHTAYFLLTDGMRYKIVLQPVNFRIPSLKSLHDAVNVWSATSEASVIFYHPLLLRNLLMELLSWSSILHKNKGRDEEQILYQWFA